MELTLKQKTAFGIGAVGKDMVYALSASYVMYYYQDVLGLSASCGAGAHGSPVL